MVHLRLIILLLTVHVQTDKYWNKYISLFRFTALLDYFLTLLQKGNNENTVLTIDLDECVILIDVVLNVGIIRTAVDQALHESSYLSETLHILKWNQNERKTLVYRLKASPEL